MTKLYNKFRQDREKLQEERKEEYSERTLQYFNMLSEMLERPDEYGDSFPFLESVFNYISHNEFITDKQCEVIDFIQSHPNNMNYEYEEIPF